MDYAKESLKLHEQWKGKIEVVATVPVSTKDDLSPVSYTHLDVYKRQLHARHAASVPSRHGHERGTCRKDGGLRQGGQDSARRLAHEFGRLSQL